MSRVKVETIKPVFSDERGIITDILRKDIQHAGLITSKKGTTRANHYHEHQTQYTYVLKGKIELSTKDLQEENAEVKTEIVEAGQLITVPERVIHKYVALEDYEIITLTTLPRSMKDYEADTHRVEI